MKKIILTFVLGTLLLNSVFGQETNTKDDKKVHAGLVFSSGTISTSFSTSHIESKGIGGYAGIGMGLDYSINKTMGFYTGVEFNFESFRYAPTVGNTFYYDYNDKEILLNKNDGATQGSMILSERKQKPITLSIPTMLIFRTGYIGYFRYFGKFGLRNTIVLDQHVNDKGTTNENFISTENVELTDMKASNDLLFLRSALGMSLGAEWNFTGSTSLLVEGGFYYGLTPLFSGNGKNDRKNSSLYNKDGSDNRTYRSFKASQVLVELKVSLLF